MAESEPKTPMESDKEETFEEAVEEATPEMSDEKHGSTEKTTPQHSRNSSLKPSDTGQKEEQQNGAQHTSEDTTHGTQEETKEAESATSSLQATPTNAYFSRDGDPISIDDTVDGELEEELSKVSVKDTKDEKHNELQQQPSYSENSKEPANTSIPNSQVNGHAKTPSVQEVPPTPSQDTAPDFPKSTQSAHTPHISEESDLSRESAIDSRPPSAPPAEDMDEQEPPVRRLIRSPFSFFSRSGSIMEKGIKSPPSGGQRRGTMSSVATMDSVGAPKDDVDRPKGPHRNSLKDRFKLLRMQEEAGIKWVGDSDGERPASSESGVGVDMKAMLPPNEEEEEEVDKTPTSPRPRTTSTADILGPAGKPTLNENLAPGTAVGTTAGPSSEHAQEVDWDLWQAVVYEGPAAVARTSPDELNQTIADGIPSAIRGVVWQVLAQSQSTELEGIYKDLVRRGEDNKPKIEVNNGLNSRLTRTTSMLRSRGSVLRRGSSSRNRSSSSKRDSSTSREKLNGVLEEQKPVQSKESDMAVVSPPPSTSVPSPPKSPEKSPAHPPLSGDNLQLVDASGEDAPLKGQDEDDKRIRDESAALQKLERAIRRDLGARTSYSKFLMSAGLQNGLFGICKAYALYDEEVGYAQGMNFIAMPLLFNMPEEEAFCLFVRLMNHYHLRDMFVRDMPGLHLHLYQFERLLEDFEPAVYCHLHRRGVTPQLYATQWFLTLFAYRFPLQLVLRIYDLILSEGLESAILKFGLVLMQKNAAKLLEMKDMAVLTTYLKERLFDVYIDKSPSASSVLESGFFGSAGGIDKEVYKADALVQDACAVKVSSEMLKQYTGEWEEKTRDEKQKLAEEEAVRAQNQSLSFKVKTLEERSQKFDSEHVQIAQTLVHTQLENQKLSDDNESLRTQISELRGIVSAQPGEVEERLRAETERIMQRNMEVQNANRHLEESMTDMENELVAAKLKAAQMEEQLEDLKAKWVSVSQVMNAAGGKGSPRVG